MITQYTPLDGTGAASQGFVPQSPFIPPFCITTKDQAKAWARLVRQNFAVAGIKMGHSEALENIAQQAGYADWNGYCPTLKEQHSTLVGTGLAISGLYLQHKFCGHILRSLPQGEDAGCWRITIQFETPVDVVASPSFSNFRSRVDAIVALNGVSFAKISNGCPQLVYGIAAD
jgi:hypothetical protein